MKSDYTAIRHLRRRWIGIAATAACALLVQSATVRAAFPGLNGKIVFTTNRDGNAEIYVMNPDGSGLVNLTNNPANDTNPAWSPDGKRIAFVSDRLGTLNVYVMNEDGSNPTNLTFSPTPEASPSWSPTGAEIVFIRNCGTRCNEVWAMNADGSNQHLVVPDSAPNFPHYFSTAWSPDGKTIAISRSNSDTNQEIYFVNPDGSNLRACTNNGVITRLPNWGPDGSKILFDRGPAGSADVYVMNADCSGQMNITKAGGQINEDADASPDGLKIVFETFRNGNADIYVMNADGSGQVPLVSSAGQDVQADWQPLVPDNRTKSLQIIFNDPDSDPLDCSATELPPGLSFDRVTGVISGTLSYTSGRTDPYMVTVTCSDGPNNPKTEIKFPWTVTDVNRPPVWTVVPDQHNREGDSVSLQLSATDPDGDPLTWSVTGLPPGLSFDPITHLISGTLPYTAAGNYQVAVSVSDGKPGGAINSSFRWEVLNTNRPPVIVNPGPQNNREGDVVVPPSVVQPTQAANLISSPLVTGGMDVTWSDRSASKLTSSVA